jgi:hypothetical protein
MWRIYYADGSTHDSDQGPPIGDRSRGVQVILQSDRDLGWVTQSGADYYILRDGQWWGCDINGLFDFLLDTGIVVFGRMIDRGDFDRIFSLAMEDRDLPVKEGFLPRRMKERKPSDGPS